MVTVRARMTRGQARAALAALPAVLAGKAPDQTGQARGVSLRLGMVALSLVKEAFVAKAAGGSDEAGDRWKPLAPSTLARRRQGEATGTPQINRDTGVLLNSLSPGAPSNVLDARPGAVSVGSSCPYAGYVHAVRPLWPPPGRWPASWRRAMLMEMARGAAQIAAGLVRGTTS